VNNDVLEPAVAAVVLKTDIARTSQTGDGDVLVLVIRAVGPLAGDRPLIEIDG
jgi:hypothetical protein